MKTIQQHLETLKEPYKTQAINNTDKETLSNTTPNLKIAIAHAFTWGTSSEGRDYWDFIHENIEQFIDNSK